MKAQLQNFYVMRFMLDAEEKRFLESFCKQANLANGYFEQSDGVILLNEDQIRAFRLALARFKPRNAHEQVLHGEFWECMPDFMVVSEKRDAYYDDLPLKADSSNRSNPGLP